jgi:hypothetical protein
MSRVLTPFFCDPAPQNNGSLKFFNYLKINTKFDFAA